MSSDNILLLDDFNWEKYVELGEKPFFVMFLSPTCPFCKQIEPYFDRYSNEFKNKVFFGKVDISKSLTISNRYGVMGTPTFKFYCKGKLVNETVGAIYPSLLKKVIEDSLKNGTGCANNTTWIDYSISGYG
jgi:thiol-disulfide isomerase/thioredoxin